MPDTTVKPTQSVTTAGSNTRPPPHATAPTPRDESEEEDEEDENDDENTEEKSFSELSQTERDEMHRQRADELTTDPIYQIRFKPYQVMAEKKGAIKISKAPDCHFYQFKGKKDEKFFLWALVRFGLPVKMQQVEKSDKRSGARALREAAKDAGIYDEIMAAILERTSAQQPKRHAQNKAAAQTRQQPSRQGNHNGGRRGRRSGVRR